MVLITRKKNVYVTCDIKLWLYYSDNDFALRNSLFGGVKLTTNPDPDKYFLFPDMVFDDKEIFHYQMVVLVTM